MKNNNVTWFVIPTKIFERAYNFYNILFDTKLDISEDMRGNEIAVFGDDKNCGIGCISSSKDYIASENGTIIYMNAHGKIDEIMNRVIPAGGKIKMPKTGIGEHGFIAHFEDSEGNIVGLHDK